MTKQETLEKNGFDFEKFKADNEYSAKNILKAMQEYGKYCAAEGWNAALKEVDALMRKPCWDLTLCEDIKKLKK